jgi:hypothetical protein
MQVVFLYGKPTLGSATLFKGPTGEAGALYPFENSPTNYIIKSSRS